MITYVDDIMLIVKGNSRRDLKQAGNDALQKIQTWSTHNNITISPEKSISLTIGKIKHFNRPPIFKLDNNNNKGTKISGRLHRLFYSFHM